MQKVSPDPPPFFSFTFLLCHEFRRQTAPPMQQPRFRAPPGRRRLRVQFLRIDPGTSGCRRGHYANRSRAINSSGSRASSIWRREHVAVRLQTFGKLKTALTPWQPREQERSSRLNLGPLGVRPAPPVGSSSQEGEPSFDRRASRTLSNVAEKHFSCCCCSKGG